MHTTAAVLRTGCSSFSTSCGGLLGGGSGGSTSEGSSLRPLSAASGQAAAASSEAAAPEVCHTEDADKHKVLKRPKHRTQVNWIAHLS